MGSLLLASGTANGVLEFACAYVGTLGVSHALQTCVFSLSAVAASGVGDYIALFSINTAAALGVGAALTAVLEVRGALPPPTRPPLFRPFPGTRADTSLTTRIRARRALSLSQPAASITRSARAALCWRSARLSQLPGGGADAGRKVSSLSTKSSAGALRAARPKTLPTRLRRASSCQPMAPWLNHLNLSTESQLLSREPVYKLL